MKILGAIKLLLFFQVAVIYILHHLILSLLLPKNAIFTRYLLNSTKFFARLSLITLGVKVNYDSYLKNKEAIKGLIVANHISYLDILVILSYHPTFFITSIEIKNSFFLGHLSRLALCVFVERRKEQRSQDAINRYIREISKRLTSGYSVCLFPEGTTSDGTSVLPFKAPLFKAAEITNSTVHIFAIRYNTQQLKYIAWYGEMNFLGHFYGLCCLANIKADLVHLSSSCVIPKTNLKEFVNHANSEITKQLFL